MNPGELKFNLIDDPWIPVVGHPRQSLRMFFSDPSLRRLGGNPVDRIAILRFLLALAHAAVELPDAAAWRALTADGLAARVRGYLEMRHGCFELYGEHPFLQFPALKKCAKIQPLSALQPSVSTGNKSVLTHWNLPDSIPPGEIPVLLLRGCGFGLGGKKYDNSMVLTPGYAGKFNDKGKPATGVPGALLGFLGYLHSYLEGETLWETVRLNMLTAEEVAELAVFPDGIGRPGWEAMPGGEDDVRARAYRRTYQGELLPLDKFYLLLPDAVAMTDGIPYPNHLTGLVDPALTLYRDNKKDRAVWTNPEKRPWRELPSILAFLREVKFRKAPYTLSCGLRKIAPETPVRVWTAGMQVSSNAGEQYVSGSNDYVESEFYFPSAERINSVGCEKYTAMLTALDGCARILYASVAGFFRELDELNGAAIASRAVAAFWERMDSESQRIADAAFGETVADDTVPPALEQSWRTLVRTLYDRFCTVGTARRLLAWSAHEPSFEKTPKTGKKG